LDKLRVNSGVPALQPPPDATRYIIPHRVKGFWHKVSKLLGFYGEKYGQNVTVSLNLRKRIVGRVLRVGRAEGAPKAGWRRAGWKPAPPVSGKREVVSDSEGEALPPPSDSSPSPEEAAGPSTSAVAEPPSPKASEPESYGGQAAQGKLRNARPTRLRQGYGGQAERRRPAGLLPACDELLQAVVGFFRPEVFVHEAAVWDEGGVAEIPPG